MSAVEDLRNEVSDWGGLIGRLRDLVGDDDQAFIDAIEGQTDVIEAARRVLRWMHEQDAQAKAMADLSDLYAARAIVFESRSEVTRQALFKLMEYLGVKSMPLPEGTLSIRAGAAKLVGECEPEKLPDELVRIKREPDKAKIKAAIAAGQYVPGYAISNGEPSLSVRVK